MTTIDIRQFRKTLRRFERNTQLKNDTCCSGVTLAQCHVILEIEEAGRATVGELAVNLGLDKSTLSRTVESLVTHGYVERAPNSSDRRIMDLTLTSLGKAKADEINRQNDAYFMSVFRQIAPDRQTEVCDGFSLLVTAMEKQPNETCCTAKHSKGNPDADTHNQ
ncbi:MAG: MarR family transcriptional regulator [Pseudomonadota bacterium]